MKLSFGERQPYRIWFDYLKTCLNDESLSKKVDRKFYKDWHLTSVKTQKFDTWYKSHEHLFTDITTTMKISSGTKSSNSILLEIPVNYSITKVQREAGKVLGNKLNKRLSKFTITSNRALVQPPLDYFLYAWKLKILCRYFALQFLYLMSNSLFLSCQVQLGIGAPSVILLANYSTEESRREYL